MAIEITTEDSAQDEVCVELWELLQYAKEQAKYHLTAGNKAEADDLIYLTSRAGASYRYHAEHPRIALVPRYLMTYVSFDHNAYYNPESVGAKIVGALEEDELYEFDMLVVLRELIGAKLIFRPLHGAKLIFRPLHKE